MVCNGQERRYDRRDHMKLEVITWERNREERR
jgi:hypothetical protein